MEKDIPQSVIKEAQSLIDRYGQCIEFIGEKNDLDYFVFRFPENSMTGFPFVYVYNSEFDDTMEITGFDALDLICELKNE